MLRSKLAFGAGSKLVRLAMMVLKFSAGLQTTARAQANPQNGPAHAGTIQPKSMEQREGSNLPS